MTRLLAWAALALAVTGCLGKKPVRSIVSSTEPALLAAARQREVPAALRSRFNFKVESELVDGSTGGALIVDRPGRGHLAILGPLGGPLVTLHTDGVGLSVVNRRDRSHRFADDADAALREATDGLAGVDDVLGLLVGELPLDGLEIEETGRTEAGDLYLHLVGPRGTAADVVLDDPTATPMRIAVTDTAGDTVLTADYGPFEAMGEGGPLMPSEVSVTVLRFGLTVDLRFKRWDPLGDEVPDVFGLDPPEGFTSRRIERIVWPTGTQVTTPGAEDPMR